MWKCKKVLKFFKKRGVEVEFHDFKKEFVRCDKIKDWLKKVDIHALFNKKGTKYRQFKLKELNLNEKDIKEKSGCVVRICL